MSNAASGREASALEAGPNDSQAYPDWRSGGSHCSSRFDRLISALRSSGEVQLMDVEDDDEGGFCTGALIDEQQVILFDAAKFIVDR